MLRGYTAVFCHLEYRIIINVYYTAAATAAALKLKLYSKNEKCTAKYNYNYYILHVFFEWGEKRVNIKLPQTIVLGENLEEFEPFVVGPATTCKLVFERIYYYHADLK